MFLKIAAARPVDAPLIRLPDSMRGSVFILLYWHN